MGFLLVCLFVCLCRCLLKNVQSKKKPHPIKSATGNDKKKTKRCFFFFFNFFGGDHGQILSHWDRLPPELRQSIQWMPDWQQAHNRLQRGWDKIHCQGFKDICQFCQVRMQPRDDHNKWCLDLPQRHCQQCNVCFDCLIYYDNDSSMRVRSTKRISTTA